MIPVGTKSLIIYSYVLFLQNIVSLLVTDHFYACDSLMQNVMLDTDVPDDGNGVLYMGDLFAFSFCLDLNLKCR
jgi:hypothetical protein